MPDDLTAELDEIRAYGYSWSRTGNAALAQSDRASRDVPRLLAALEAVLKLHQPGCVTILGALCERHEAHRHFSITRTEADDVRSCPDCKATVYASCTGCGRGVSVDACLNRLAITRELAGEEARGGDRR